jgi:SOS response associated peptidase (SRAP)
VFRNDSALQVKGALRVPGEFCTSELKWKQPMCGRYYRKSDKQRIAEAFQLSDADEMPLEVAPSYNVAPTTMQPVIVSDRDTGKRALRVMRWGLIPFWTKDDPKKLGVSPSAPRPKRCWKNLSGSRRFSSAVVWSRQTGLRMATAGSDAQAALRLCHERRLPAGVRGSVGTMESVVRGRGTFLRHHHHGAERARSART